MRIRTQLRATILFVLLIPVLMAATAGPSRAVMPPPVQALPFDPGDPDDGDTSFVIPPIKHVEVPAAQLRHASEPRLRERAVQADPASGPSPSGFRSEVRNCPNLILLFLRVHSLW